MPAQAASIRWSRMVALSAAGALLCTLSTCSPRVTVIEQVQALGALRVATINSATTYYEGPSGPTGFEYDLALGFAAQLGVKLELVLATRRSETLEMVRNGRAHLAAASLSVTPLSSARIRFSRPVLTVVPQLIYRAGKRPETLEDIGEGLVVPRGSAAAEHLAQLKRTVPGLSWTEAAELDTEELLQQVADGQIAYTVAASDLTAINLRYYPALRVAFDLTGKQDVAWAFSDAPDRSLYLLAQQYLGDMSKADLAHLRDRYFGHVDQVDRYGAVTLAEHAQTRLPKYRALFEKAGKEFGLDWRLLAAIGYQESHWDSSAVSPTGVRGIMQLTTETARFLNVANREDPAQSIRGGSRYIRRLIDLVSADVPDPDRTWLALSAYNMGYGHLLDAQDLVRLRRGDPRRWIDVRAALPLLTQPRWYQKTRYGYARGHEAENYVGNVRTYYDMLVYIFGDPPKPPEEIEVPKPPAPPVEEPLNIRTPVL
ncbi:MAG: membrane-bound lytic murein transglycosylase MltF [Panacagrimonas sp.]